jgi:hypothetical protein
MPVGRSPASSSEPIGTSASDEAEAGTFPATDPTGSVRLSLKGIASIVAPGTLVTGLLYYFGWARTSWQAQQMGLEESLLGYSVQDYILRSLSAMFWPLMIGLLAVLGALAVHVALVAWATRRMAGADAGARCRRILRAAIAVLLATALGCLAYWIATAFDPDPSRFESLVAPLSALMVVVCTAYAGHLYRRFLQPHRGVASRELVVLRQVGGSLVVTLMLVILFWAVSHYAAVKGVDLALEVENGLGRLPDATIYSTQRLYLQPPVVETELAAEDDAGYRYAYGGLKFLFLTDGKYFLRPTDPSASKRNIVIQENDTLRLELVGH